MAHLVRFTPDPEYPDLGTADFEDGSSIYTRADALPPALRVPDARLAGPADMAIDWTQLNAGRDQDVAAEQANRAIAKPQAHMGGYTAEEKARFAEYSAAEAAAEESRLAAARRAQAERFGSGQSAPAPAPGSEAAIDAQVAHALANPIVTSSAPKAPLKPGTELPTVGSLEQTAAAPSTQGVAPGKNPFSDLISAPVYRAGSAGVDPEAMLRNGVYVPTGGRLTTEAGAPYDPAEAQVRELANQKVVEAHIATSESQIAQANAQQKMAEAALPDLQRQADATKAHYDSIQASYQRDRAQLQGEIDDFDRGAKVDPNRFFARRGAWSQIGAIIGQALGSFAATSSGSPNWAQEAINREIDRDISAQVETLNQGRLSQRSALGRLADRYGDVQQAATALKLAQQQIADRQIMAFGLASQKDDIANAAREWVANNQKARTDEELGFYHASIGKSTQERQQAFVQPQAATGGGLEHDPTKILKAMAERAKASGDIATYDQLVRNIQSGKGEFAGPNGEGAESHPLAVYAPDGKTLLGYAPNRTTSNNLRANLAGVTSLRKVVGEMVDLAEKGTPLIGQDKRRWDALKQQAAIEAANVSITSGKPAESEIQAYREAIPEVSPWKPNSYVVGGLKQILSSAEDTVRQRMGVTLRPTAPSKSGAGSSGPEQEREQEGH